ncbi:hypothetical protein CerSpe_241800 [Prunus speciosa]
MFRTVSPYPFFVGNNLDNVAHFHCLSAVLGKIRDFLGVISEANERLEKDAKDNSKNYDIEALTGNESLSLSLTYTHTYTCTYTEGIYNLFWVDLN